MDVEQFKKPKAEPKMKSKKPVVLVIMDGWGSAPASQHNAITEAETPVFDSLIKNYPNGLLNASEVHVGLPVGQMGNSEVGHLGIGGGRVILSDLERISAALADGSKAEKLQEFIKKSKAGTGVVHLTGLISDGGVHSHQEHTEKLAKIFSENGLTVKLHLFTDGRDVPPKSAIEYIEKLQSDLAGAKNVSIATIGGRAYGMDRDKNWEKTIKPAYDAMVSGKGETASSAIEAVEKSYSNGKTDEFILPTVIGDYKGMNEGDSLFISNFRSDRVKQISTALLDPEFDGFERDKKIDFSAKFAMTKYSDEIAKLIPNLFEQEHHANVLAEVISKSGLKQLHIAETEKYSHVTSFFNGGRDKPFEGEDRILVPSPKVKSYDLKPEMSAHEVTDKLLEAINSNKYDFIVVNYANADMVGHTGNIPATIKAVKTVDECLGRVRYATLAKGGTMLVTADHGNADRMVDPITDEPHTAHTTNLVPIIEVSNAVCGKNSKREIGSLRDIAPTILNLLGLKIPKEMTGKPFDFDTLAKNASNY